MKFAEQLKSERKRIGLTQSGAESRLRLCRGQITAWETARNVPHRWMQEGCLRELREKHKNKNRSKSTG